MRRIITLLLPAVLSGLLSSCASPRTYYSETEVVIHGCGATDDGLEIVYTTFAESMFYCPGVKTVRKGARLDVYFLRCPINGECPPVDAPGKPKAPGKRIIKIPVCSSEALPVAVYLNGKRFLFRWEKPD